MTIGYSRARKRSPSSRTRCCCPCSYAYNYFIIKRVNVPNGLRSGPQKTVCTSVAVAAAALLNDEAFSNSVAEWCVVSDDLCVHVRVNADVFMCLGHMDREMKLFLRRRTLYIQTIAIVNGPCCTNTHSHTYRVRRCISHI